MAQKPLDLHKVHRIYELFESSSSPSTIHHSLFTIYHALAVICSPWETVKGKRTINGKWPMVNASPQGLSENGSLKYPVGITPQREGRLRWLP